MTGLVWLAVIVGGFLFTYRAAYRIISHSDDNPDAETRAMNAIMAFGVALIWPVAIIGWLVWRFATPQTAADMRAKKKQLEAEIAAAEKKLRQRERELGVNLPPLPPRD